MAKVPRSGWNWEINSIMEHTTIAFIARASRYSPGSVGKDLAILSAVRQQLASLGYPCLDIVREDVAGDMEADAFVSMARSQDMLNWLGNHERRDIPVVNSTASVMICNQRPLEMSVLEGEVNVPPMTGSDGYWVKRGYGCRQCDADVQFAPDWDAAQQAARSMSARGIHSVDIRSHVVGDWVKFYGVRGTRFFYYCRPQGGSNPIDEQMLRVQADQAARTVNLDVYGGDFIVRSDGTPVLVDLNDWPSFSPCREEAAKAIVIRVRQQIHGVAD